MLSGFTGEKEKKSLKDFFVVPKNVYPVGRLDYDSEGLLILTDDKYLTNLLLNPAYEHEREYWIQVEGNITNEAIDELQQGVQINVNGKMVRTKKCQAEILITPPDIEERKPSIRFRKNIPESWIRLILTEGKNRQVRKMTAKTGFPTLRLIRNRIEKLTIDPLKPGEMKIISQAELYNLSLIHI